MRKMTQIWKATARHSYVDDEGKVHHRSTVETTFTLVVSPLSNISDVLKKCIKLLNTKASKRDYPNYRITKIEFDSWVDG